MLINRIADERSGRAGDAEMQNLEDNSNELQTAEDIYQIMAKTNAFEGDGDKALTTRDLVILYKNIDIDAKLVPTANQQTSPNQFVETVIYNDDRESEGSDLSEVISNEDFQHVFAVNEERIDILNNFGDTLCHKFGDMHMHTSDLTTEYDRHFLFNDPFIKDQLKNFHDIFKPKHSDSTVLPASLLDYICCKRIEENYSFYMDNIIKYVQNTIEQLKRISNGDYLTEKAKEKWREGNVVNVPTSECEKTVLTSSVSIPLRVKDKRTNNRSTWDDIVHSEMDVRSICKILEKKVIVEVPKIICGSYMLFSKRCKDNLIITCKKDKKLEEESRVDVVLKLQRSKSGHVISNIDSIIVLKSLPASKETDTHCNDLLALEFKNDNVLDENEQDNEIIALDENIEVTPSNDTAQENEMTYLDANIKATLSNNKARENEMTDLDANIGETFPNDKADCSSIADTEKEAEKLLEDDYDFRVQSDCREECGSIRAEGDLEECGSIRAEADFNRIATGNLHCIIHQLSMQTPVIEESEDNLKKKKSPMRVRIKSPYENKSHVMEEKRRKKLLEIREKREIKKNAMSENCKVTKYKYGKMVQASNSVTKLSITNKSFYNSIYGQSMNINNKNIRNHHKDQPRDSIPEIELGDDEETHFKETPSSTLESPDNNNQKYINRSYYLDDAETEVMYLQRKQDENQDLQDALSTSTTHIGVNLNLLQQLIAPSDSSTDTSSMLQSLLFDDSFVTNKEENTQKNASVATQSIQLSVPTNSPIINSLTRDESCKTSDECRKSIDKVYHLIKKIGETDGLEVSCSKNKIVNDIDKLHNKICDRDAQPTDSGTSIKHQLTSSNPSFYSFEKATTVLNNSNELKKKYDNPVSVIPKISSKAPTNKLNNKTNNKEFRLSCSKIPENPLKAISQLIHEFDNVQKMVKRNEKESKRNKKTEVLATEDKTTSRQNFIKRLPKQDQYIKDSETISSKNLKERRRQSTGYSPFRIAHQQLQADESALDTTNRKKITDIIDEVKELRGEAVRGPSKKLTRLNSLAQPKKTYLQGQQEESQNRIGKRVTDRLPKPMPPVSNTEKSTGQMSIRNKQRRIFDGLPTSPKQPQTAGSPSERLSRTKPPTHNNQSRETSAKRSPGSLGKPRCYHSNVTKTPEQLKGKMVAVETYVKNHYGRETHLLDLGDSHIAHKSRVPLIPNDLDLASMASSPSGAEESTVLGKKIHNMIDTMMNSTMPVLDALTECNESTSKSVGDFDDISIEGKSKSDDILLSGSDYPVDIFEDKDIVTAVSVISENIKNDVVVIDNNSNTNVCETNHPHPSNEFLTNRQNNESQIDKKALCQISNGTFQKPLRNKKFSLNITPKQSVENVVIFQSGDTSSLVLKSKISQHIIDLKTDTYKELKYLPAQYQNRIDFGFTFPMQIATVGYVLPQFVKRASKSNVHSIINEDLIRIKSELFETIVKNTTLSKSTHCIEGADLKLAEEKIKVNKSDVSQFTDTNEKKAIVDNCERHAIETQNNEQKTQDNDVETKTIDDIGGADVVNSKTSNSTSLDILVGLLNEIKNITSYQAHISKRENNYETDLANKEFEIILNKTTVEESSVDNSVTNVTSLQSIDNLQILEARASNFVYLSSNIEDCYRNKIVSDKDEMTNTSLFCGPSNEDKEVNATNLQTECKIHRFTEVPSRFFPVSVSTNVTDSLLKLINKPSGRCIYSITNNCESSSTSISNKIREIPINSLVNAVDDSTSSPVLEIQYFNEKENDTKKEQNNHSIVDFDPLMKMKRDILVTVYSILVLTVFAALSFPELMYRV